MTFEEIETLAKKVLDGKSDSYVAAARILATTLLRDYKPTLDNLTATQARCTELLELNRELWLLFETQFGLDQTVVSTRTTEIGLSVLSDEPWGF